MRKGRETSACLEAVEVEGVGLHTLDPFGLFLRRQPYRNGIYPVVTKANTKMHANL